MDFAHLASVGMLAGLMSLSSSVFVTFVHVASHWIRCPSFDICALFGLNPKPICAQRARHMNLLALVWVTFQFHLKELGTPKNTAARKAALGTFGSLSQTSSSLILALDVGSQVANVVAQSMSKSPNSLRDAPQGTSNGNPIHRDPFLDVSVSC